MESTRIGIGERKKYTKAAYKKAGGEQNGRKLFRIKKKRAPKIARNYLYHVLYLCGLYVAALIAALILDLVFHSENEIFTEIISLLFFLQFVPLVAETVWIIVKAPIQFVRFIRKQYEKRRDRKIKENEKRDAKCEDYGILIRHEISSRIK